MSDTSLRFNFLLGRDTASPHMKKVAANASVMGAAMATVSALAASRMLVLGASLTVVAGHAIALGQSAIVASGAVALLPAALAGAVGTAVAAKTAFGGLGEAWKATGAAAMSGGGASVDVAHRVELANRGVRDATQALADAQRDALDAQEAVTRARETAAERLEDLSRSLRGARLDERGSVEALADAKKRLSEARATRDVGEIRRAQLAYDEAALSLETVRDRVEDLSKEQEQANAKGVEGSDEVQSAIQRQEQAQRQLVTATERLADAQRDLAQAGKSAGGGVNKAGQALAALAPSAAALVLTLRAMAPAWVAAGKGAQQATWVGVAGDMQNLGMIYLPRVSGWLRRMGEGFNLAIRQTLGLAQTNAFARDVGTSLEFIDQAVRRLAGSIRPFVNGFMQFVAVGAGFLPGMASSVGSIAERFERWAIAARESGQMQQWISNGLSALSQFWTVSKNVVMSVVALFAAGENTATLTGLVSATAAMRSWLESARGQEAIAGLMAKLRDLFSSLAPIIGAVVTEGGGLADIFSVTVVIAGFLANHLETFKQVLPLLIDLFIAWKVVQLANNVATLASTVATAAATAARWLHVTATIAADAVTKRATVSMIAARAALVAGAVATGVVTAAQWLWNIAMTANPIGLIILAVVAFIAIIIVVIKYHKEIAAWIGQAWDFIWNKIKEFGLWMWNTFAPALFDALTWPYRKAWEGIRYVWGLITNAATAAREWVVDRLVSLVNCVTSLPGKMKTAAANLWDGLKDSFRSALNWLIVKWNNFSLTLGGGTVLGMAIPSVTLNTPNIPLLDVGGHVTTTGLAVIHKGEDVVPAAETTTLQRGGGGPRGRLTIGSDGSTTGRALVELLRGAVRDMGGDFDVLFEA